MGCRSESEQIAPGLVQVVLAPLARGATLPQEAVGSGSVAGKLWEVLEGKGEATFTTLIGKRQEDCDEDFKDKDLTRIPSLHGTLLQASDTFRVRSTVARTASKVGLGRPEREASVALGLAQQQQR